MRVATHIKWNSLRKQHQKPFMSDGVPEGSPVQKHKWGGALFNVPRDGKNMIKRAQVWWFNVWENMIKCPWGVITAEKPRSTDTYSAVHHTPEQRRAALFTAVTKQHQVFQVNQFAKPTKSVPVGALYSDSYYFSQILVDFHNKSVLPLDATKYESALKIGCICTFDVWIWIRSYR